MDNIQLKTSKGKKYPFKAEELQPENEKSLSSHELIYTKTMAGTASVSIGEYDPSEWSFKTHVKYPKNNPYKYNNMIKDLHNNIVEVNCPLIGDIYTAYVTVTKQPVENHPYWFELTFKLKEIPSTKDPIITRIFNNPNKYNLFEGRLEK